MMLTLESIALFEVLLKGKFQITDVIDLKPNDNISVWATPFFLEVSTQQAGSQIYILFWHWFSCISRCRYHPPKISIHIHSYGHLICIINSHHWHIHDKKKQYLRDSNRDPRVLESNAHPFDLLKTSTQTYEQICDHIVHVCGDNIICQMHLWRALIRFSRTKFPTLSK